MSDAVAQAVLVAGLLAALLGASLYLGEDARATRRVILSFVFRVALPMAILLGLPLVALGQAVDLQDRLWQALIAGLVIATGWLATAIFAETERAARKAERTRDFHKALFAEIQNALSVFYGEGQAEPHARDLIGRMEADPSFVPFIPQEHHARVFEALAKDIEVLPRQTIDTVVAFYSHVAAIAALAEDMRGPGFRRLPQDRRIALYRHYIDMRLRAFAVGQYLLKLIAAYADGGPERAEECHECHERGPELGADVVMPVHPLILSTKALGGAWDEREKDLVQDVVCECKRVRRRAVRAERQRCARFDPHCIHVALFVGRRTDLDRERAFGHLLALAQRKLDAVRPSNGRERSGDRQQLG